MTTRVLAALPLLLLSLGCVEESQRGLLVPPGSEPPKTTALRPIFQGTRDPGHEASTKRLYAVGGRLIEANPQAGLRPQFASVGAPHPEIFHSGGGLSGYLIVASDGLINRCKSDAELAAVIAMEMGKIVAERESAAGPSLHQPEKPLPPDVPIGPDAGGHFGSPDGTRVMEVARQQPKRARTDRPAPPSPQALAKTYLAKAGFDAAVLVEVGPLLRQADGHAEVEKAIKMAELDAPVKTPAPSGEKQPK